ncbi:MAG: AIR synthase-related protein, partial [Bacteroidota bacterium]
LSEMAQASQCGFSVQTDQIPVGAAVKEVADLFEVDPLISVGAGSMLMAVKAGTEKRLIEGLAEAGIPAAAIGEFTSAADQILVNAQGARQPFVFDGVDPYWGAFFRAYEAGWK